MPSVITARTFGVTPASTRNRVAVLHHLLGFATLTFTDPEVAHDNMGRDWTELARQEDYPFLLSKGVKLRTMTLKATVAGSNRFDTSPVATVQLLRRMAEHHDPVTIGYGTLEVGLWQISSFAATTTLREPNGDDVVQADVVLGLKAASAIPVTPGTPPPKASTAVAGQPARVTVTAGDTLFSISTAVFGTPDSWQKIADLNNIADPRLLPVGQQLIMP